MNMAKESSMLSRSSQHYHDMNLYEIALRSLWICVQVSCAYLLADQVSPFFYQQF